MNYIKRFIQIQKFVWIPEKNRDNLSKVLKVKLS